MILVRAVLGQQPVSIPPERTRSLGRDMFAHVCATIALASNIAALFSRLSQQPMSNAGLHVGLLCAQVR